MFWKKILSQEEKIDYIYSRLKAQHDAIRLKRTIYFMLFFSLIYVYFLILPKLNTEHLAKTWTSIFSSYISSIVSPIVNDITNNMIQESVWNNVNLDSKEVNTLIEENNIDSKILDILKNR